MSKRTEKAETAGDAAMRALSEAGITVPKLPDGTRPLQSAQRSDGDLGYPAVSRRRFDRLAQLGWPIRALEWAWRISAADWGGSDTDAVRAVRLWDSARSALVLSGGRGCGKTVAAAWRALTDPPNALFRFCDAPRAARIGRYSSGWAELVDAPALCLDDLGAEYLDTKESFVADVSELVNAFYASKRRLLLTTNLSGDELAERYGARVLDRLMECAEWIGIGGGSMRGRARSADDNEPPPWED